MIHFYIAVKRSDLQSLDLQGLRCYAAQLKKHYLQNKYWCKSFNVKTIFSEKNKKLTITEDGNYFFYKIKLALFCRLLVTRSKTLKIFFTKARLVQVFPGGKRVFVNNKTHQK